MFTNILKNIFYNQDIIHLNLSIISFHANLKFHNLANEHGIINNKKWNKIQMLQNVQHTADNYRNLSLM